MAPLRDLKVRALPVVDRHQRVIGVVTIADFLRQLEHAEGRDAGQRLRRFLTPSSRNHTDKPEVAGHLMSREPVTVGENQHVMDLFSIHLSHGVHHLPVLDADGKLSGMLTPKDLLRTLYGEMLRCGARRDAVDEPPPNSP